MYEMLSFIWCGSFALLVWSTVYAIKSLKSKAPNLVVFRPVSILKPLKGLDPGLSDNLESFFNIDWPLYELVFSVASLDDPAIPIITKLLGKYPKAHCKLIVGEMEEAGPNPKVRNLAKPEAEAAYDTILVSDSNVRAYPEYLRDLMPYLVGRTGVVTATVRAFDGEGVWGLLEESQLNAFYTRWMFAAKGFGMPFVIGKTMLYSRYNAAKFGGIASLGHCLAEDFMFGTKMKEAGERVEVANAPTQQFVGPRSLKEYWLRHYRWATLRRGSVAAVFWLSPLHFSYVIGLVGAIGWSGVIGADPLKFFLLSVASWTTADMLLTYVMGTMPWPAIILLREALAPFIWMHAMVSTSITWRGEKYRVRGGKIERIEPPG